MIYGEQLLIVVYNKVEGSVSSLTNSIVSTADANPSVRAGAVRQVLDALNANSSLSGVELVCVQLVSPALSNSFSDPTRRRAQSPPDR